MAVTLLFNKTNVMIDTVELDASLSEGHSRKVTVTRHPIEDGSKITDHMIIEPDTVTIEGIVTNTPLPDALASSALQEYVSPSGVKYNFTSSSSLQPDRAGNAYQALLDISASPDLIDIHTSIRDYSKMKMTSLDVPRDAASGQALKFSATFEEIQVVTNQTAQIKMSTKKNKKVIKNKKVAPTAPEKKSRSLLKIVSDKVGEILTPGAK